jgi:ATP-dependent helicase/nuclease subunit B
VLAHLAAGRSPVALVAQDRVLTRRVSALLWGKDVALRDETGWKLSTTRAAATLMGLLRMLPWDASTDAVLDWLKNAPAFDGADVARAETALRKMGIRQWRAVSGAQHEMEALVLKVNGLRAGLQAARPLADWLQALQGALESSAQWAGLVGDTAGLRVIAALHMTDHLADKVADGLSLPINPRFSLQDFTAWVNQTLEADSFAPAHPPVAQVVILPLSQLLGRPMQAVVLPGCDEIRLPASPEPPGQWATSQRALLGLPTRQVLADAQRAAWQYALTAPHLDVLWRLSESGESLMPSGFVQELLLNQKIAISPDLRSLRMLTAQPPLQPAPTAQALPITQLSASAYEDLRRCPYRFFALRQLKLQEADELESELGKRDFGNWLHLLLNTFQNALKEVSNQPPDQQIHARAAMINIAAEEATKTLGLSAEEFLPFAAIWPRVRDGYLDWLAAHEASGASYVEGEVFKHMPLGNIELVGKIDRIDQMSDGSRLVMDYKTEPSSTTKGRIKDADEDTQLAFYAALLHDDTLAAAYVNLGEKEATKTYAQPEIVELRDDLIGGILSDIGRIADGAPLPALGEGKACEFCAARGLCRKDFWS